VRDDVENGDTAYQHALYHLPNPKASQVWYGIGMLYERCGSLEHAEEAFTGVLKMDPNSDKKTDILFRLGTIYKQTQKYPQVRFRPGYRASKALKALFRLYSCFINL
jgi:glucose repression mediator protein